MFLLHFFKFAADDCNDYKNLSDADRKGSYETPIGKVLFVIYKSFMDGIVL